MKRMVVMAPSSSKQIVRRFHADIIETGKFDLINHYLSQNFVLHTPYLSHSLKGRDKFREFITTVYSAITNLKVITNVVIAEGNSVAVRWTIEGLSTNDFLNIPAGGDHRSICVMSHYRLRNGRIVEAWAVDSSMWPKVYDF